jgi:glycosyltransferase involved in cell wall biosynthesis
MTRLSICFFVKVKHRDVLDRVEFYAQDIRILKDLGYEVRIATSLQEIRPADLYFIWWWTWALPVLVLARSLGARCLITGVWDDADFLRRPAWHRSLIKLALRRADANVFCSQLEYQTIPRKYITGNPQFSTLVVDTDTYQPSEAPREDFILTVAWTGRYNAPRKCIPEVVRAAALLRETYPSLRFIIAGERGDYYPKLAELTTYLGVEDCVEFPGVISRETKIELLQRCLVYLQPTRFEGFGMAMLEAMACAAPVVSSPAGVVPEVVGDTAVLVDGTSPEAIREAVAELIANPGLREDLGCRARQRAETVFPYERRKHELGAIIEQLLQARGHQ